MISGVFYLSKGILAGFPGRPAGPALPGGPLAPYKTDFINTQTKTVRPRVTFGLGNLILPLIKIKHNQKDREQEWLHRVMIKIKLHSQSFHELLCFLSFQTGLLFPS